MTANRDVLADVLHAKACGCGPNAERDDPQYHELADAVLSSSWLVEHDASKDRKIAALLSALERTEHNFRLAVAGKPVRDMCENLAENEAARAGAEREDVPTPKFEQDFLNRQIEFEDDIRDDPSEGAPAHSSRREVSEK